MTNVTATGIAGCPRKPDLHARFSANNVTADRRRGERRQQPDAGLRHDQPPRPAPRAAPAAMAASPGFLTRLATARARRRAPRRRLMRIRPGATGSRASLPARRSRPLPPTRTATSRASPRPTRAPRRRLPITSRTGSPRSPARRQRRASSMTTGTAASARRILEVPRQPLPMGQAAPWLEEATGSAATDYIYVNGRLLGTFAGTASSSATGGSGDSGETGSLLRLPQGPPGAASSWQPKHSRARGQPPARAESSSLAAGLAAGRHRAAVPRAEAHRFRSDAAGTRSRVRGLRQQ